MKYMSGRWICDQLGNDRQKGRKGGRKKEEKEGERKRKDRKKNLLKHRKYTQIGLYNSIENNSAFKFALKYKKCKAILKIITFQTCF